MRTDTVPGACPRRSILPSASACCCSPGIRPCTMAADLPTTRCAAARGAVFRSPRQMAVERRGQYIGANAAQHGEAGLRRGQRAGRWWLALLANAGVSSNALSTRRWGLQWPR